MEQYMSKTHGNYGSGVVRPKINDKTHFELKGQYLKELCANTFSGSEHEDANEHIEKFIEIVDLFHIPKTAKKMEEINNFQHEPDESLFRAWERFKELLMKCAQHYLTDMQEVILFYNGVDVPTRQILESKGAIPTKTATLEESLTKFMVESAKRHEENSKIIKEIRASTDAAIRNHRASIKTIEIQIGQTSKVHSAEAYFMRPFPSHGDYNTTVVMIGERHMMTIKQPRGIAKNVLVRIGKFIFPIDFIILDIPEDDNVPLILGRPFLSTAYSKIDIYKRKFTLRVREEKLVFKSIKPATSIIRRVFMLKILDLKTKLIREDNESFDPLYGNFIELNDFDTPLEPETNHDVDFEPTVVNEPDSVKTSSKCCYKMKFSYTIGYKMLMLTSSLHFPLI
nr:hypothetical protein [Tanacetum cinerariifolium]